MTRIRTPAEIDALYAPPSARALAKVVTELNPKHKGFLARSTFYVMASGSRAGLDVSPRGDSRGGVRVLDDQTLVLANRPGNRRHDGLRNLLTDDRIALLFFVPGLSETLRVNGRAEIHADPTLAAHFEERGHIPRVVLIIRIEEVFHHCSKAFMRSKFWDTTHHQPDVPLISTTDPKIFEPILFTELPVPGKPSTK